MSSSKIRQLAKIEKRPRIKMRYLAVSHFLDGESKTDIAKYLKVARGSVNKWIQAYLDNGIESLRDSKNPGRPQGLTIIQRQVLSQFISKNGFSDSGGRMQAKDVSEFILNEFNIEYQRSNIYRLLHQLGFSWITSRSKHPKQNEEAQRLFKNLSTGNDRSHTRSYASG